MRGLVGRRGVEYDARRTALLQLLDHVQDQRARDALAAEPLIDVNVVQRTARFEQLVPVPFLEASVRVARDDAVLLGNPQHGRRVLQFLREPPRVALLDVIDEHESVRIEPVVQPDECASEAAEFIEIFGLCRSDLHRVAMQCAIHATATREVKRFRRGWNIPMQAFAGRFLRRPRFALLQAAWRADSIEAQLP